MRDYLARLVPFLLDGQAVGEPVAVAVPGPNLDAIRDEFAARGGDTGGVRWLDMINAGCNPGRIIPAVLRAFADQHDGQRVRILGEPIWRGRGQVEYPACVQHEALINTAFGGRPATILCPYNTRQLDPVALIEALATHPIVVVDEQGERPSDAYEPDRVVSHYNQPLDTPTAPHRFSVTATELAVVRQWATDLTSDIGLDSDRLADVAFVANELVSNGIEHGKGDITGVADQIRYRVDRRPVRVYSGPCGAPTDDGLCPGHLSVHPGRSTVVCPVCGAEHDVAERREWMTDRARDLLLTAPVALGWARLLLDHEVPVGHLAVLAVPAAHPHPRHRPGRPAALPVR